MKPSSILCMSFVALAAFAVTTEAATAATTLASSKSNSSERIDPNDPAAVKACKDAGGTVSKDRAGNTICTKPAPAPAATAPSGY